MYTMRGDQTMHDIRTRAVKAGPDAMEFLAAMVLQFGKGGAVRVPEESLMDVWPRGAEAPEIIWAKDHNNGWTTITVRKKGEAPVDKPALVSLVGVLKESKPGLWLLQLVHYCSYRVWSYLEKHRPGGGFR